MKSIFKLSALAILVALFLTSCNNMNQSIREANILIELSKDDFELTEQVVGRAERVQIFGIDFKRMFNKEKGHTIPTSIASEVSSDQRVAFNSFNLPVIGTVIGNPAASYALYNLFAENPGNDVVFYPQYKIQVKRPIGFGFIYKRTKVEVKARMGKLK